MPRHNYSLYRLTRARQLMTYYEMIERFDRGMKHTRLESNSSFARRVDGVTNAVVSAIVNIPRTQQGRYQSSFVVFDDSFFPAKCFDRPK